MIYGKVFTSKFCLSAPDILPILSLFLLSRERWNKMSLIYIPRKSVTMCKKRRAYTEMIPVLHMCDQKHKYMSLWEENCPETGNLYMKNSFTMTTYYKVMISCEPKEN